MNSEKATKWTDKQKIPNVQEPIRAEEEDVGESEHVSRP